MIVLRHKFLLQT